VEREAERTISEEIDLGERVVPLKVQ